MTTLVVPSVEETPWPTLGPQVCADIERHLVHGPGDLRGKRARLDLEKRALIYRAYEVYPHNFPTEELRGRRRFKRVAWSLRKGSAKTELASWIAAVELHPRSRVRCIGFSRSGQPIGGPVTDPYIPLMAYTEEQSEDLAYGALRYILGASEWADDFDIGLERIMRIGGDGKAAALATAPDARDGARTTFQVFDESHRFVLPRQKEAHRVMLANVPKRRGSDAWSLEITTAPTPGENSVAEDTMAYARSIYEKRASDSKLFFFHRQASDDADLATRAGIHAAVLEASCSTCKPGAPCGQPCLATWSDIEGIVDQFEDPTADQAYLRRVWLNQLVRPTLRAFDMAVWNLRARPLARIPVGAHVALGFNGSRRRDATALIATDIVTGLQEPLGIWERPDTAPPAWETPSADVDAAVRAAMDRWRVWRLYADPTNWDEQIRLWIGEFGEEVVVPYATRQVQKYIFAVRSFGEALTNNEGGLTHGGPADLARDYTRHIGNAHRHIVNTLGDDEQKLWYPEKESGDSPNKINAVRAGILSWQCRLDAIEEGVGRVIEQDYTVEALA